MLQQIACILAFSLLLTAAPAARSGFAGTWKGMENGLPSIEMTIHDGPQGIGGVIGFYFQTREADGKWHLHDKTTVPLLSPKVEHGVLTFETIHHKKHSSPELGPNNRYRFELLGRTQGRLHVLREHGNEDAAALTLTRAR